MTDAKERLENLGLDFEEAGGPLARIYVQLACGYLSDQGAPTLTKDCRSLAEFESEVERLKNECDVILAEAGTRLPDARSSAAKPRKQDARTRTVEASSEKKPLHIAADLLVEERMTRDVRSVRRNDKLSVAQELMREGGFRHVLVLEDSDDHLAGVISQRDIFHSALAWATGRGEHMHEHSLDLVPAKEVMNTQPTTVSPKSPLREAAALMIEKKIGCLPVLQGDRVVGILTEGDFLSLITGALVE